MKLKSLMQHSMWIRSVAITICLLILATDFSFILSSDIVNATTIDKDIFEYKYVAYPKRLKRMHIATGHIIKIAKGSKVKIFNNSYEPSYVKWQTKNNKIASIVKTTKNKDESIATIRGESIGKVKITSYDKVYDREMNVYIKVTNPRITNKQPFQLVGDDAKKKLRLIGTNSSANKIKTFSKVANFKRLAYVSKGFIRNGKKGSGSISVYVDGKRIKLRVKSYKPVLRAKGGFQRQIYKTMTNFNYGWPLELGRFDSRDTVFTYVKRGKTMRFKLRNVPKNAKVKYKVINKKNASISKTGKLKAKRRGAVTVKATICGKTYKRKIYVLKPKEFKIIKKTFKYAKRIRKGTLRYSMSKRMHKNYADCSSFVWKVCKAGKMTFGSPNYAPSAVGEYKWLKRHHKMLNKKKLSKKAYSRTLPCDLVFYRYNGSNQGHVSIAIGYGYCCGIGAEATGTAVIAAVPLSVTSVGRLL
jgi:hypothetical protein